ncbi:cannabidiolic acid synthase-like [Dorcoceras hygrometricum]|uniref:Cannabidiolic acid synthase-like n=1 Tax=Dorcoceras hygrometricum TaxID=472368 RepID=A0A2Z7C926_9LAMI|nr:cannabidiolic acid synthase-like [Dorcoceras hygrometricum]
MKFVGIFALSFLLIFSCSLEVSGEEHYAEFLECLNHEFKDKSSFSEDVYTPSNSSYTSILRFSIQNLRFETPSTPKPLVIITPHQESQVPPIICCARENGLEIRTRSGGHDYEGLSYVAKIPFVVIDLINFSLVSVDAESKTAWVQSGATLGELYYRISEKSRTLAFPAGLCTTIGVGGHFSGGGYGMLMRKYGLSADNVVDAKIVDVEGRILDRRSMGEDLFWAIRGGGGASFGVILAWKIQLLDVPENVTVFSVDRTFEQNAIQLIHRWQSIAHKLDKDLFIRVILSRANASQDSSRNYTIRASFNSLFLGGIDRLLPIMQESFPELGLVREQCTQGSWIQSVVSLAGFQTRETLLNRTQPQVRFFKGKSDYVQNPIPENGLEGLWRFFNEPEAKDAYMIMSPYGGRMAEIPASSIPFPHRAGNLYKIQHFLFWEASEAQNSDSYISWIRGLYSYMTPYVSKSPRAAYLNYRDLDIGANNDNGTTSYEQAKIWGSKYFKTNFDRLVRVKTEVDPENFFKNEQSIPPLLRQWKN